MEDRGEALIALVMGIGLPVNLLIFVRSVLTPAGMCYAIESGGGISSCLPSILYYGTWGIAIGFLIYGVVKLASVIRA
jgi:hypothetical protein